MRNRFLHWLGFGMLALAILSVSVVLVRIAADIVDTHQKGGDLATWIGALGTVGALCMTIHIAHADSKRRRSEQSALARVTAATLQDVVIRMKFELDLAIETAENCRDAVLEQGRGTALNKKFIIAAAAMHRIPTISREELRDLIPATQRSAMALAGAQGGVFNCRMMLEDVQRKESIVEILRDMNSIVFRLKVSQTLVELVEQDIQVIVMRSGFEEEE